MLLFVLAVVVALVGVGAYDLYNPGAYDIALPGYHFAAVPVWVPVGLGAAGPLVVFFLYSLWVGVRIRLLKRAARQPVPWEARRLAPATDWHDPVPVEQRPVERRRYDPRQLERRPAERRQYDPKQLERRPAERRPVERRQVVEVPGAAGRRKRASQAPPPQPGPQPAPKRSWLNSRD